MATDFSVGDRVRLIAQPPYFKTADPMPMLRPPDTLAIGAEGVVQSHRPGGYWGIKFEKGAFLVDSQYLENADAPAVLTEASETSLALPETDPSRPGSI